MAIDLKDLQELIASVATTDITELTLKHDDFELTVRKQPPSLPMAASQPLAVVGTPAPVAAGADAIAVAAVPVPATIDKKWLEVKSPMVGTFYRAPAPEEPPFIAVGDRISTGKIICIIEAMKLMNELESEVSGQVVEILVENGQPVEFGQVLMYVNPG
jgi:acetyl-CoA carboxylase biotin carboxyl carrier protein